jgi:alkylhydroperoxidase family enzyme
MLMATASGASAQTMVDPPGGRQPTPAAMRVAPLPPAAWTEAQKALVDKFARYGPADNAARTLLQVPDLFDGVMPYTIYLSEDSKLTAKQRELLILRAAWLNGNQYLWARHAPRARQAGLSNADLKRLAEGPTAKGLDPLDATLLAMSDQLHRNASVTDATWAALSKSFDLFHLMDAVETANHFMVLALIYNTFGVQPDAGNADRLPTDVAYRVTVPPREPPLAVARAVPPAGRGIAVGRTFGLYPELSRNWSPRQTFILQKSPVTPRHREMFILRMGWNCRSEYEWSQHVGPVGRAREWGLEPKNIALGPTAPGWDPIEATILKASDEVYRDGVVSDATWQALVDRFGIPWTMSGVFSTADYRAISLSLNTYGVQHEPTDETFPVF